MKPPKRLNNNSDGGGGSGHCAGSAQRTPEERRAQPTAAADRQPNKIYWLFMIYSRFVDFLAFSVHMHYNPHECFLDQSLTLFICSFLSTTDLPPPFPILRHTQSHAATGHGNPFHRPPSVVCRVIIHRLYTYYVIIIYISRYVYRRTPFVRVCIPSSFLYCCTL